MSATFEDGADIAEARALARDFLTTVQTRHGLPVSAETTGIVQLVVSELVTNARKYAPGPCRLDLEISKGDLQISVWDSSTTQPTVQTADPTRIGQHGLEIVMAVSQSFCIHREPVGKRIIATLQLADDPGNEAARHHTQMACGGIARAARTDHPRHRER
ncbi:MULTISPECIES: ATP-binding protein [unclassified Streptomyces]|uniref:ATP-binding protein n=1 Tax=unclassified Streptomyces TaxID=2593676 RepID=UPI0033AD3CEF